jgi:predicted Zn-dependent peptidase
VTLELLLSAPVADGIEPDDFIGLDAIVRSGPAKDLQAIASELASAELDAKPATEKKSDDPATRLQQLIRSNAIPTTHARATPLAIIVSGNVAPEKVMDILEQQFGRTQPVKFPAAASSGRKPLATTVRERIAKPLAQGGLAYVVEGPRVGTRDALVWQMLLYVLTHDYSGRLGLSAIRDKGIVYHVYSKVRTDGARTFATISTGVDPEKADAMEAELRAQLARLATQPPTLAEVDAARNHILGRDLSGSQSNEELAARLARQFVENGALRSHEQLRALLQTIGPADLQAAARSFAMGTIIRLDVAAGPKS